MILTQPLWMLLAWCVTRPAVRRWLSNRAVLRPYSHIMSDDGRDLYMARFWLFNPYATERGERVEGSDADARPWWLRILPSVRMHYIARPDRDRDLHDHPWNARTIILDGWYEEERYSWWLADPIDRQVLYARQGGIVSPMPAEDDRSLFLRKPGYTGRLRFGEFHRISRVGPDGVWTLFITWRKRGTWGFDVAGRKVPWREYLAQRGQQ